MGELFWTVVVAVTILVIGQIIIKFVIDPIHEQKKVIKEIAETLTFYANVYANPSINEKEEINKASTKLRQLSTKLDSKVQPTYCYVWLEWIGIVRDSSRIRKASTILRQLSNSMCQPLYLKGPVNGQEEKRESIALDNKTLADEVRALLNLKID